MFQQREVVRIRPEQMEAFAVQRREDFEQRAIAELTETYPEDAQEMGSRALQQFTQNAIASALNYGIDDENDLLSYLFLAMDFGEGFDKDPDLPVCQTVLPDPELSGSAKIGILYDVLTNDEA